MTVWRGDLSAAVLVARREAASTVEAVGAIEAAWTVEKAAEDRRVSSSVFAKART